MGFGPLPQRHGYHTREKLHREIENIRSECDELWKEFDVLRKECNEVMERDEARKERDETTQKLARMEACQDEISSQVALMFETFQQMKPGEVTLRCISYYYLISFFKFSDGHNHEISGIYNPLIVF